MPRAKTLAEEEILATLTDVFRTHGYEGASLKIISNETGLARASLYHRFPGGKAEMAEAVMSRAQRWLDDQALAPLRDPSLSPAERIRAMTGKLDAFYESGEKSCLLDALSLGEAGSPLRRQARTALELWTRSLADTVVAAGFGRAEAARRAEEAVILVQGALVVARVREDPAPFRRVLAELPERLLEE